MDCLKNILKNKKLSTKKNRAEKWQDDALEAIKFLVDGKLYQSQIFKCFKLNSNNAKIAQLECKELEKPFSRYFLKVWNNLNKKSR